MCKNIDLYTGSNPVLTTKQHIERQTSSIYRAPEDMMGYDTTKKCYVC